MNIHEEIKKLEQEIFDKKESLRALRKKVEAVEIKDYELSGLEGEKILLSQCFNGQEELLVIFNMGQSCKYCTLWADNLNGISKPLADRAALLVVSPDAPEQQAAFAESRGWDFPMLSHKGSGFAQDLNMLQENGMQMPGASSFTLKEGKIYHHSQVHFGPGDNFCNLWDFVDLLPKGVNNWVPKYEY